MEASQTFAIDPSGFLADLPELEFSEARLQVDAIDEVEMLRLDGSWRSLRYVEASSEGATSETRRETKGAKFMVKALSKGSVLRVSVGDQTTTVGIVLSSEDRISFLRIREASKDEAAAQVENRVRVVQQAFSARQSSELCSSSGSWTLG